MASVRSPPAREVEESRPICSWSAGKECHELGRRSFFLNMGSGRGDICVEEVRSGTERGLGKPLHDIWVALGRGLEHGMFVHLEKADFIVVNHDWGRTSHFILEISEKSFAKAGVWLNTVCIHNLISNKSVVLSSRNCSRD